MYLPQTPGSLPKPRSIENPDRFLPAQSSFIVSYNSSETWAFAASVTHTICVFLFFQTPRWIFRIGKKVPQVRTQGRIRELRRSPLLEPRLAVRVRFYAGLAIWVWYGILDMLLA